MVFPKAEEYRGGGHENWQIYAKFYNKMSSGPAMQHRDLKSQKSHERNRIDLKKVVFPVELLKMRKIQNSFRYERSAA
jgi:hypothetical protein